MREQFADRIPSAYKTCRVRSRGFADGRLVYKHHFTDLLRAQQTLECARRFSGFAKVAQQGRGQHVLHQRRFARTAHTGNAHKALQRNLDRHIFQVMFGHSFEHQAGRIAAHHALKAHAHLLASAKVRARQGVRTFQVFGTTVKHNLAAFFARARAHVDHAVGGQHHRRVMLHHHQGIARIAQALHGHDDAVHVPWMQANAGLVQHKQGVHERGAQGSCEVDALHFTAAQGSALAVQSEVADAHFAQVFQARGDFFQQQFERLLVGF